MRRSGRAAHGDGPCKERTRTRLQPGVGDSGLRHLSSGLAAGLATPACSDQGRGYRMGSGSPLHSPGQARSGRGARRGGRVWSVVPTEMQGREGVMDPLLLRRVSPSTALLMPSLMPSWGPSWAGPGHTSRPLLPGPLPHIRCPPASSASSQAGVGPHPVHFLLRAGPKGWCPWPGRQVPSPCSRFPIWTFRRVLPSKLWTSTDTRVSPS